MIWLVIICNFYDFPKRHQKNADDFNYQLFYNLFINMFSFFICPISIIIGIYYPQLFALKCRQIKQNGNVEGYVSEIVCSMSCDIP
jgi:hypothetical protein